MLAPEQRVRHRADFTAAVRAGRRAGRGSLVVHLLIPATVPAGACDVAVPGPARAGFIVAKTVGNAAVRNTVRRRLRHLVRPRLTQLPADALLVVRALPAAAGSPSARLGADLDAAIAAASRPVSRRPRSAGNERQTVAPGSGHRGSRGPGDA